VVVAHGSRSAPPGDTGGVCYDGGGSRAGWEVDGERFRVIDRRGGKGLAGGVIAVDPEIDGLAEALDVAAAVERIVNRMVNMPGSLSLISRAISVVAVRFGWLVLTIISFLIFYTLGSMVETGGARLVGDGLRARCGQQRDRLARGRPGRDVNYL
jgi:hypothetical protein